MKVNCNQCANMYADNFTAVYKCKALNCGCHLEESNFIFKTGGSIPRMVPDVGEGKCPGMVKPGFASLG